MPRWPSIDLSWWYRRSLAVLVADLVAEPDAAVALEGDPVVGPGQVLGGQPEVDGVGGDVAQSASGGELGLDRLLAPVHLLGRLADHLDVAHRVVEVVGRRSRSR